eukprot:9286744-Pyramimonas_sp.AAC.1
MSRATATTAMMFKTFTATIAVAYVRINRAKCTHARMGNGRERARETVGERSSTLKAPLRADSTRRGTCSPPPLTSLSP